MTATALDCRRHDALIVSINDDAIEVVDLRGLIKTGLVELSLVNHHVALVRVGQIHVLDHGREVMLDGKAVVGMESVGADKCLVGMKLAHAVER